VSTPVVRKLIEREELAATQVAPSAPWEIPAEALDTDAVRRAVEAARAGGRAARQHAAENATLTLPGILPDK